MKTAMKRIPAKTVDEYLETFPPATKILLKKIRDTIKAAAPQAEEIISYGIAGYKFHGMLIYFAGFTNHVSIYPAPREAASFKKELADYKGGKGTVQFSLDKPLPLDLIKRIVKFRTNANEERTAIKKVKLPLKAVKAGKLTDEEQVKAWMTKLSPVTKKEIESVRKIIKRSSPKLNERIKWNAPSYYYKQDIVTFGPYNKNKILLVFHHPAVVKVKSVLLEGNYKDRRLVYFNNKTEAEKNKSELSRIINEIIKSIDKK